MTVDGTTVDDTTVGGRPVDATARTVTPARAAQELELGREEFRLAVRMGLIRTVPVQAPAPLPAPGAPARDRGSGRVRAREWRPVERAELDRLKAAPDFPDGLRARVRTVGTGEAAGLLSITHDRFVRLARTGHLSPVRFYLNRYRAVIWLYVAAEVTAFGEDHPALLTGRLPAEVRARAAVEDLRARNWRTRHLGLLLRGTDDPWARAAAIASLLDPVQLAEVVDDPYERNHLDRLRPPPPPGFPVSGASREIADRLVRADDPDEILWHRVSLALALDEARAACQAPHPGDGARPTTEPLRGGEERPRGGEERPRDGADRPRDVAERPRGGEERPGGGAGRPPGRAVARTRRPGLLARIRRSLPGATAGSGWGERRDWG
ncbi:DUF6397 family protein [Streptomyces sp. NPDC085466]|uniref:DUF6397 family protein n=1 Tax=Streptomyces sp. NPDC085466 TaxID=3365725 RepID=UPI0037CEDD1F